MANRKVNETHREPVVRTNAGLRAAMFDEIDGMRAGTSNPTRANAVAKLATVVIDSVRMELEVAKYIRGVPSDEGAEIEQKIAKGPIGSTPLSLV